jgi:hypothetical protein
MSTFAQNLTRLPTTGSGDAGAAAGATEPARVMAAQMAQYSNAGVVGFNGSDETAGPALDDASADGAKPEERGNSA